MDYFKIVQLFRAYHLSNRLHKSNCDVRQGEVRWLYVDYEYVDDREMRIGEMPFYGENETKMCWVDACSTRPSRSMMRVNVHD